MRVRVLSTVLATLVVLAFSSCQTTTEGEAVGVTLEPAVVELAPGATVDFGATVTGTSDTGVTWSATGGTFVVHESGVEATYTAPEVEGDYEVTATSAADGDASATATVHVVAEVEQVVVSIDPSEAEMMLHHSREFSVSVSGADDPGVTWSATGGTIFGSGATIEYKAPSILGVYEVTATSVADPGASATATVHVVAYPGQAWALQFGSEWGDRMMAMAIDRVDNIVVAGYTNGDLFGANAGAYDAFVAKISADGTPLWAFQYGTAGDDIANAVAVDSGDNVLLVGETRGDLFGANAGASDAFVVKISPAGVVLWGVQHGTAGWDSASAVAVDSTDNVILGGSTYGDLFAPNQGASDAFIAKMTAGGLPVGGFQYGSSEAEHGYALAVDSADNVVQAGATNGALFAANQGSNDGFIAKFSPTGVPLVEVQYGTIREDAVGALAVDSADAIVLAGSTSGDLFAANQGSSDAFVAKVSPNGMPVWAFQYGTGGYDFGSAVAVGSGDNVLFGGQTWGDLFGATEGSADAVFAELGPDGGTGREGQFGSMTSDSLAAVAIDSTGRFVLAGWTYGEVAGPQQGDYDAFLIVLAP